MNVIEEFIYAVTAIAALAQAPMRPAVEVYADPIHHECRYVVAATSEGLHIIPNGGEHCRDRILIDGKRIAHERAAVD